MTAATPTATTEIALVDPINTLRVTPIAIIGIKGLWAGAHGVAAVVVAVVVVVAVAAVEVGGNAGASAAAAPITTVDIRAAALVALDAGEGNTNVSLE